MEEVVNETNKYNVIFEPKITGTCPCDSIRGKNTVKSVQNEKYSAKSADFLRFMLYLCHVIDDFACLDLQH